MRFSLKWLGDFIETSPFFRDPNPLADKLTTAGLEIDSIENPAQDYDKIFIAQIESVEKHPQADRLTVCKVKTDKNIYQIVCGAKNHKAGDKVVLTQMGAVLPNKLKIKKSRIRGVESEGMLASRSELGFPSQEEGIWILPESAPLGQSFSKYFGLDDILFDISVPPNRADCLSHKGLAREIACLFSLKLKKPELPESRLSRENGNPDKAPDFSNKIGALEQEKLKKDPSLSLLPVAVQDTEACPHYCASFIKGVSIKESPDWLKKRLQSIGLKSINNVVDITNFILWDQGQPLHAFDKDKIQQIQVGLAKPEAKFVSLDNQELKLTSEDLVIKDNNRILALAGIIGGLDSSITSQTKNIVIESAYFAPQRIRKTARRLGIETDSSYRFTRGVDPSHVLLAMERACLLIQQVAGGTLAKDFYDSNPVPKKAKAIFISAPQVSERLGCPVSASDLKKELLALGCDVQAEGAIFKVIPPSYRSDLNIKEDLIEEFARLSAYDKIPESLPQSPPPQDSFTKDLAPPSSAQDSPPKESSRQKPGSGFANSQKLIDFLSASSWSQSINYSFCDPQYFKDFSGKICYLEDLLSPEKSDSVTAQQQSDSKKSFSVKNPISQTLSLMKPLLTPDLFKNVLHNFRRNNKQGQLFELSPVFYKTPKGYQQEEHLALAMWGQPLDLWNKESPNFYKIKGWVESLLQVFQIKRWAWEVGQVPFGHPKQTLILTYQKQKVAYISTLHPQYGKKYKIPIDVVLAEIKADFLLKKQREIKFKAFSPLGTLEKDLCFDIPLRILAGDVAKEIQKTLQCVQVEIFDIYQKEEKRFVSFRLFLEPKEKSWTDQELQAFLKQAIKAVNHKFNITLKT